jgi:hypothetical protein
VIIGLIVVGLTCGGCGMWLGLWFRRAEATFEEPDLGESGMAYPPPSLHSLRRERSRLWEALGVNRRQIQAVEKAHATSEAA